MYSIVTRELGSLDCSYPKHSYCREFSLLGYVKLEGQPFKLEVEKMLPQLLGKGDDVPCSYTLVFETTFCYSETRILCF
jgi:hypothetical protein